jgi:hypothetical protein
MHRHVARIRSDQIQSSPDGILPMHATGNDMPNLLTFRPPNEFLQLGQTIAAANQNDLIDAFRPLERIQRVRNDRLIPEQREQFVEAHALTAARGNDDGGEHECAKALKGCSVAAVKACKLQQPMVSKFLDAATL